MTATNAADKAEAVAKLRDLLPPGSTVYTILRHVSRSGMSRSISAVAIREDGGVWELDGLVSRALGMTLDRNRGGVKMGGCGMDMGFALVYDLAYTLYPKGFGCIGEKCRSNDHSNGDRDYTPHGHRGPRYDGTKESLAHWHNSGGYSISHRWL